MCDHDEECAVLKMLLTISFKPWGAFSFVVDRMRLISILRRRCPRFFLSSCCGDTLEKNIFLQNIRSDSKESETTGEILISCELGKFVSVHLHTCFGLCGECSSHITHLKLQSSGFVSNVMRHGAWRTAVGVVVGFVIFPYMPVRDNNSMLISCSPKKLYCCSPKKLY